MSLNCVGRDDEQCNVATWKNHKFEKWRSPECVLICSWICAELAKNPAPSTSTEDDPDWTIDFTEISKLSKGFLWPVWSVRGKKKYFFSKREREVFLWPVWSVRGYFQAFQPIMTSVFLFKRDDWEVTCLNSDFIKKKCFQKVLFIILQYKFVNIFNFLI